MDSCCVNFSVVRRSFSSRSFSSSTSALPDFKRVVKERNRKPEPDQVWTNSTLLENLKRDKRDRTSDSEDPGEGSWPSIEKIIRDVERSFRGREQGYSSLPYSYGWDASQLAAPFEEEAESGRRQSWKSRSGHSEELEAGDMLRDLQLPSQLTTSRPHIRPGHTDRFVYRRVGANEKKILAISIRRSLTTTLSPHQRVAQDQWQAVSNSKAHLHHRWLQKGKLRGKLLT